MKSVSTWTGGVAAAGAAMVALPARAADAASLLSGAGGLAAGSAIVLALLGGLTVAILTSSRLSGSSLFNRLFIVVATTSAFFSAVSSAIGFSLITSQETADFFRNDILPPAFGVFVFFLGIAVWIGGAELVRHRDWFRGLGNGPVATALQFIERSIKIFVVIPILSLILFVVSTWTTVVGIAGVDAVRLTYSYELDRLQSECAAIVGWRQRDLIALAELRQSVRDTTNAADREREGGFQTGSAGRGAVADYFDGVAQWYASVEQSVAETLAAPDPSGASPFEPEICAARSQKLREALSANAYVNYDAWANEFESAFNDFAIVLNRWRQDQRVETFLKSQQASFERANPKPVAGISAAQSRAINRFSESVAATLEESAKELRSYKPPIPLRSAAEISPERGLAIVAALFEKKALTSDDGKKKKKPARNAAVIAAERIPGISVITPRDAVLKHAQVFSDVWALGISWDYASYVLMLAFLFFPSAERAAGRKDD